MFFVIRFHRIFPKRREQAPALHHTGLRTSTPTDFIYYLLSIIYYLLSDFCPALHHTGRRGRRPLHSAFSSGRRGTALAVDEVSHRIFSKRREQAPALHHTTLFHLKLYTIDFRRKSAPYACRQPACSSLNELLRAVGGAGGRFASAAGALLPPSGARNNFERKFLVETKYYFVSVIFYPPQADRVMGHRTVKASILYRARFLRSFCLYLLRFLILRRMKILPRDG